MPIDNAFRPQPFSDQPPRAVYRLCRGEIAGDRGDDDAIRAAFQRADVQRVLLIHGTFVGNDALGLFRGLERIVPGAADRMRQLSQEWVDWLAADVGNYTDRFVRRLSQLLSASAVELPVERLIWSGENHHIGRADAAVELVDRLLRHAEHDCSRFLLWGHSHAGNVLALVTNLLAGPRHAVRQFFAACRPLFLSTQVSQEDRERWQRVRHSLIHRRDLAEKLRLDIVTFGTPVRYGWETRGYRQLLHVVHHRPAPGLPEYRVPFPFSWEDLQTVRCGDYVQQLGIAGTDLLPSLINWRALRVERRLNGLLERGLSRRKTLSRLKLGVRVADEGTVLLVDYPLDEQRQREQLLGHGIYTSLDWLPYHLRQVAEHFYFVN